jgi:hypothetical protein
MASAVINVPGGGAICLTRFPLLKSGFLPSLID